VTAFGSPFTLGVEEELLLVDPESRMLIPVAERVLAAMDAADDAAAHEAYAAEIELRSPAATGAGEAIAALAELRAEASGTGEAALIGAGVHPLGELGDAPVVELDRYQRVGAEMRGLVRRTPECAFHVHVGLPDHEAAIRAHNVLRDNHPLLVALAANSPWWFGTDSGMASARFFLVAPYPGRGVPPALRDWSHYEEVSATAIAAGGLEDYTYLWWDVRPHPKLGTLETREMDAQSSLDDAAALAALVQGLARAGAESPAADPAPAEALAWSSFHAARDGLDAQLWVEGSRVPAREAARKAADLAGAHDAGPELEGLERILTEGNGAERQRAAAKSGPEALLEMLVAETCAPASGG
jgi:carboxylate-amine ligase